MKMLGDSKKSIVAILMTAVLAGCGGGDSDNGNEGHSGPAQPVGDNVKFNLSGAVSVMTTEADTKTKSALKAKSNRVTSSNLFAVSDDGTLKEALGSDYNLDIAFTHLTKDGKTLIVALSDDWNSYYDGGNQEFIDATHCAILKVDTATNATDCLIKDTYAAQPVEFYNSIKQTNRTPKPVQSDSKGNVYFISSSTEYVTEQTSGLLTRVDANGNRRVLTGDNISVTSFVVNDDDSLIYSGEDKVTYDHTGLVMIPDVTDKVLSTVNLRDLDVGGQVALDDAGAFFIFGGSYNYAASGITRVTPSPLFPGGVDIKQFDRDAAVIADDGFFYSAESIYDTQTDHYLSVKRSLPYSAQRVTADNSMYGNWQIAQGYIYFLKSAQMGDDNSGLGNRDVFVARNIDNGEEKTIFDGDVTAERLKIHSWKLVGNRIHFVGFNNANSTMVSGQIDTVALRDGKPEADYLVLNVNPSVLRESEVIGDMEEVRPSRPDFAGGRPSVALLEDRQDNSSTVTLEFSKWMDEQSVEKAIKIVNAETQEEVPHWFMWFGNVAHIVLDNDDTTRKQDRLARDTEFELTIADGAKDSDGYELPAKSFTWHTLGGNTWAVMTDIVPVEGYVDSGVMYVSHENENQAAPMVVNIPHSEADGIIVSNPIKISEFDHEFSFTTRMGDSWSLYEQSTDSYGYSSKNELLRVDDGLRYWQYSSFELVEPVVINRPLFGDWVRHTVTVKYNEEKEGWKIVHQQTSPNGNSDTAEYVTKDRYEQPTDRMISLHLSMQGKSKEFSDDDYSRYWGEVMMDNFEVKELASEHPVTVYSQSFDTPPTDTGIFIQGTQN